ncbi:MAG: hypothetical protein COA69_03290 [Robiginitomaculum sp.]|nr:MAG: hypothetical protein COA69_03290 [Robiginitomaculum sp.]
MVGKSSILGSLFALTAVVLGAFGAHALKSNLDLSQLSAYETGVRYQFYHAFALFVVWFLAQSKSGQGYPKFLSLAVWCFTFGILLFCGSLYLLACRDLLGLASWTWLGPLTPIGGLLFIVGWTFVLLSQITSKKTSVVND